MLRRSALEKYLGENGLFPAAIGSENRLMNDWFWIRDNYYIWLAGGEKVKKRIGSAFQKFIDYNIFLGKFDNIPKEEYEFIHPLCTGEMQEITVDNLKQGWAFIQTDSYGNLLEVMSEIGDQRRADIMADYLNTISFWDLKDYGFWECGVREIHASSLAACLRGLESYESSFGISVKNLKYNGYDSLQEVLRVGETLGRESDLALMSLLYPGKLDARIITPRASGKIIASLGCLEGGYGFRRFLGDDWDGLVHIGDDKLVGGQEMQWGIGSSWKYLITRDKDDYDRTIISKEKYGCCEGVVPVDRSDLSKGWQMNCTPFLFWTKGMQSLITKS
ncbi:MAG: hypothetical protein KKF50_00385 [Nanoarchaeota archaeon]|nr:hypothetical protein [Nanoarchaeota archaeon]